MRKNTCVILLVSLCCLAGLVCLWARDATSAKIDILAARQLSDGGSLRIVQYPGPDFYTTELRVAYYRNIAPRVELQFVLDGDDRKRSSAEIHEEVDGVIRVTLGKYVYRFKKDQALKSANILLEEKKWPTGILSRETMK